MLNFMRSFIAGKTLLQILFWFIITPQICFAQWFWQNPLPQGNNLGYVYPLTEDSLIIAGNAGTIIHTSNGGGGWEQIGNLNGQYKYLRALQFINDKNAYLAGDNIIYKTDDGGRTWINLLEKDIISFCFTTLKRGYLLCGDTVYQTQDGGNTWTQTILPAMFTLTKIGFADTLKGWVLGYAGELFITTNGGITWTQSGLGNYWDLFNIFFITPDIGWIVGGAAKIYKTSNGGQNWTEQHSGYDWEQLTGIYFKDESYGWAWRHRDYILKTTNGGNTWSNVNLNELNDIVDMKFFNDNTGWAAGNNGVIFKTTNGGINWIMQYSSQRAFTLNTTEWINTQEGWVAGLNSTATANLTLYTSDGGSTWADKSINIGEDGSSIFFIDNNTGWQTTSSMNGGGHIFKTTDSGTNWIEKYSSNYKLKKIQFVSSNNGWAVSENTILKTTDGGEQWTENQVISDNPYLRSGYFIDNNIGWICGLAGNPQSFTLISKTTDGGTTWQQQTVQYYGILMDIYFINSDTGWAVGEFEAIFKTTNGGISWSLQHQGESISSLYTVWFTDHNNGWAAGEWKALHTTNGGETWTSFIYADRPIYAIKFVDENIGWMTGLDGIILKTNNGGISGVETNDNKNLMSNFTIEQNFPNPFNPTTIISYSIPSNSLVQLKIFDILGEEIETLVNEEKPTGTYEVNWSASNLPSGVYFYRLQAGSFVQTRKMILLK